MNLKDCTLQEVISLIGPYQQASKELGIKDNNESYSFSGFKANEALMLKYFPKKKFTTWMKNFQKLWKIGIIHLVLKR